MFSWKDWTLVPYKSNGLTYKRTTELTDHKYEKTTIDRVLAIKN